VSAGSLLDEGADAVGESEGGDEIAKAIDGARADGADGRCRRAAANKCREYLRRVTRRRGATRPALVLVTDSEAEGKSESDDD